MKRVNLAALAATAVLAAHPAAAAVLDQASVPESGPFYWGSYISNSLVLQTFTVGKSGILDRIEVAVASTSAYSNNDITLDLFGMPLDLTAPLPVPLASAFVARSKLPTTPTLSLSELTAFDLSAANLAVHVGDVYAFSVHSDNIGTNPSGSAYAGGVGYAFFDGLGFQPYADLGFRTYVDSAVPEAGTWALMIGGFGLAGAALRPRRGVAV